MHDSSYLFFQLLNWSLAVPLTLWFVPGLLLLRPVNPRVIFHEIRQPKKTLVQRLTAFPLAVGLLCWIALTVIFVAPLRGRLQVCHVRLPPPPLSISLLRYIYGPLNSYVSRLLGWTDSTVWINHLCSEDVCLQCSPIPNSPTIKPTESRKLCSSTTCSLSVIRDAVFLRLRIIIGTPIDQTSENFFARVPKYSSAGTPRLDQETYIEISTSTESQFQSSGIFWISLFHRIFEISLGLRVLSDFFLISGLWIRSRHLLRGVLLLLPIVVRMFPDIYLRHRNSIST